MADTLDQALAEAKHRRRLPPPDRRRAIREQCGISQTAIARELGTTTSAVSRYESGRRLPRGGILRAYVAVLDRLRQETA